LYRAQDDLAQDSGLAKTPLSPTAFSIGHNVAQPEQVDQVTERARRAGATIVKPPARTFYGGYAAYSATSTGTSGRWCTTPPAFQRMTD
jgi:uncharacterized glyoxalase superfamily protein PhnB